MAASSRKFYVYGIIVDQTFRYIGMGHANRVTKLGMHNDRMRDALAEGCDIYGVILKDKLTKSEAFAVESIALAASAKTLWNYSFVSSGEWTRLVRSDPKWKRKYKNTIRAIMRDPIKGKNIRRGLASGRTRGVRLIMWQRPDYRKKQQASLLLFYTTKRGITRRRKISLTMRKRAAVISKMNKERAIRAKRDRRYRNRRKRIMRQAGLIAWQARRNRVARDPQYKQELANSIRQARLKAWETRRKRMKTDLAYKRAFHASRQRALQKAWKTRKQKAG
jgi:hypothetical protein